MKYSNTTTNERKTKWLEAKTSVLWSNTAINWHHWPKLVAGIMGISQKHNMWFLSSTEKHNAQFYEHNSLMPRWLSGIMWYLMFNVYHYRIPYAFNVYPLEAIHFLLNQLLIVIDFLFSSMQFIGHTVFYLSPMYLQFQLALYYHLYIRLSLVTYLLCLW